MSKPLTRYKFTQKCFPKYHLNDYHLCGFRVNVKCFTLPTSWLLCYSGFRRWKNIKQKLLFDFMIPWDFLVIWRYKKIEIEMFLRIKLGKFLNLDSHVFKTFIMNLYFFGLQNTSMNIFHHHENLFSYVQSPHCTI